MGILILYAAVVSTLSLIAGIVILLLMPTRSDRAHMIREEVADQLAAKGVSR